MVFAADVVVVAIHRLHVCRERDRQHLADRLQSTRHHHLTVSLREILRPRHSLHVVAEMRATRTGMYADPYPASG